MSFEAKCPSNPLFNFNFTLYKLPTSGYEVTNPCGPGITCFTQGYHFGVKEYLYKGTINLVSGQGWIISYLECCRNPVTIINNASSSNMYVEANVNTNYSSNNLPYFIETPKMVFNLGELVTFNNTTCDADGDSLSYELIAGRQGIIYPLFYSSPYSGFNFCSSSIPIQLNHETGQITMRPDYALSTVVIVRVDEWKKTSTGYFEYSYL